MRSLFPVSSFSNTKLVKRKSNNEHYHRDNKYLKREEKTSFRTEQSDDETEATHIDRTATTSAQQSQPPKPVVTYLKNSKVINGRKKMKATDLIRRRRS